MQCAWKAAVLALLIRLLAFYLAACHFQSDRLCIRQSWSNVTAVAALAAVAWLNAGTAAVFVCKVLMFRPDHAP